jgi:hypothetical protein
MTILLSTSRRRNSLLEDELFRYESNSILLKSEYSYDQYHWWPIVLIVILGVKTSSSIYNNLIEGSPIKIKINEGDTVQNNSNC